MLERSKKTMLFIVFSSLMIGPTTSFAWHDYTYHDWDWYGSGRDHPYSYYISNYYSPDRVDYSMYDLDEAVTPIYPAPEPNEFTVNVPNDRGGYNAVIIKRSGNGFVGPQGEYYPEFPKVFQLKLMYGK
jgi:hypothetical protein